MKRHHRHLRLAYLILLTLLIASGAIIFYKQAPMRSPRTIAYLSSPESPSGNHVQATLFPNATKTINLTLNNPTQRASLSINGVGQDILIALSGTPILEAIGALAGATHTITTATPTTLDIAKAPFKDDNGNLIADDYEQRHKLGQKQIETDYDSDKLSALKEYEYFLTTGREVDPLRLDTDGDSTGDGTEIIIGTNPIDDRDVPIHPFAESPWYFTQNEILSDPALVAYYTFETSGNEELDRIPLSLRENATLDTSPFSQGLRTIGRSRGASTGFSPPFKDLDPFTISAWIVTTDNRSRTIAAIPTPDGRIGAGIDFGSSRPQCSVTISNITYTAKSLTWRILADNQGHHVTCTRSNGLLTIIVDGIIEGSTTVPSGPIDSEGTLVVANDPSGALPFFGLIDNIAIYNSTKNPQTINQTFYSLAAGADRDHDGMSDSWEQRFALSNRVPSDAIRDDDADGMTNRQEYHYYFLTGRPIDPKLADTDGDGYSDLSEREAGVDPTSSKDRPGMPPESSLDSDRDGTPDWWELAFSLNIAKNDSPQDVDGDTMDNLEEYAYFIRTGRLISPTERDSDHDGVDDRTEIETFADPSSTPLERVDTLLPSRIHVDIPNEATITHASATIQSSQQVLIANQHDQKSYLAGGAVDILPLLSTRCTTPLCRNVITLAAGAGGTNQTSATITDIDIRYTINPHLPDPLPLCSTYPCTFPLTIRTTTPGTITFTLTGAEPCDSDCMQRANMKCPADITCDIPGIEPRQREAEERLRSATAPSAIQPRNETSSEPTSTGNGTFYLILLGAVAIGLAAAFLYVRFTSITTKPAVSTTKNKEHYVSNAHTYLTGALKKGESLQSAKQKLVDSGWPEHYVEEAARRIRP